MLYCGASLSAVVVPGDVGQGPKLLGREIAQGQRDRHRCVTGLALRHDIAIAPGLKPIGMRTIAKRLSAARGLLIGDAEIA